MTLPVPDPLTYATASALRDCLRDQLAASLFGPVCRSMVAYGAVGPGLDGCDCTCTDAGGEPTGTGTAWVRVAGIGVAALVRDARGGTSGGSNCAGPYVVTYELGVSRCYPTTDDGRPLPAADVDAAAQRFLSDQFAVLRTPRCCAKLDEHAGTELVAVNPRGPSGGCAGVVATIRVTQARG